MVCETQRYLVSEVCTARPGCHGTNKMLSASGEIRASS